MATVDIRFGALSPPLHEQINEQFNNINVTAEQLEKEQKFAHAISLLNVHSLLTERETESARKRLMKKIVKTLDSIYDEAHSTDD